MSKAGKKQTRFGAAIGLPPLARTERILMRQVWGFVALTCVISGFLLDKLLAMLLSLFLGYTLSVLQMAIYFESDAKRTRDLMNAFRKHDKEACPECGKPL